MKVIFFSTLFWGGLVLWNGVKQTEGTYEVYILHAEAWLMGVSRETTQLNISVEGSACDGEWADPNLLCSLTDCSTASPASNQSLTSVRVEFIGEGCNWIWDCSVEQTRALSNQSTLCSSCESHPGVCGSLGDCYNGNITYGCHCNSGYMNRYNITTESCVDVDECKENSTICGPNANCTNIAGSYTCECDEDYIPSPGLDWQLGVSTCTSVTDVINTGECEGSKSVEQCQLDYVANLLNSSTSLVLSPNTVKTLLNTVLGAVDSLSKKNGKVGEKEIDDALKSTEILVSTLVMPTQNQSSTNITTEEIDVQTFAIGPEANLTETPQLKAKDNFVSINLLGIAENNNGSAAVAFLAYTNMGDVLKAELFHTENDTIKTMMASVVSASLPKTKNTTLTKPVNFTLRHLTQVDPEGQLTCVYWNESRWIVDGCEATETNATHTVCTCVHLSTFALIMQIDRPPEEDGFLELINIIAVSVGLLFLALAILTFICCRWNPKINNTARLHLSICLFLAHLLFLLVQSFLHHIHPHELVCAVLSGVLHFLFLSSFVWMYLEALQLFLLVRNLREVRIIQREGIHWGYLLVIGYGLPCLVVGVSAGLVPAGYGSDQCWLKTENSFRWSFLGPVCYILAANVILFIAIIGHLWSALAALDKEISQIRDTRVMVFKALVQFVILGGPWILGFFVNNNEMLQYLFLVSTSQQGTFIFLVHCALNKEVQEQYRRWWKILCCSCDSSDTSDSSDSSGTLMTSRSTTR